MYIKSILLISLNDFLFEPMSHFGAKNEVLKNFFKVLHQERDQYLQQNHIDDFLKKLFFIVNGLP